MNSELDVPVAFLIYKRPDVTRRVFAAIAAARPRRLYVIADGPRDEAEAARCAATRAIIEEVDWPCEVFTNYAETNLGLKRRVSSGLDWVFAHEEQAIILEDDCLPDPTFFRFCAELLERYANDPRVMHISGDNFLPDKRFGRTSYIFTRYIYVWGWATWRRAWQHFDIDMQSWKDATIRSRLLQQFANPQERRFWNNVWEQTSAGQINSWDYAWAFACMASNGLGIIPSKNLVTNIGFGPNATHTLVKSGFGPVPSASMEFPLIHPDVVARDIAVDSLLGKLASTRPPLHARIAFRLSQISSSLLRRQSKS
ncbi:MAG: glycosyltransferase family 2 protein [Chloroflexota bacterium]|jgi:hypothetical protein